MVYEVPPHYFLTRGQRSCFSQEQKVMVRSGHKTNAKKSEKCTSTLADKPALLRHYKMQHLSLILLAKLLLFFFPFFSLLSSIFLARISLIRSKNTLSTLARVLAEVST